MARGDAATMFQRWAWMRALSFRGYWLVTSLYLVIDADLSAFQLVFLGTAMELTVLACAGLVVTRSHAGRNSGRVLTSTR